MWPCTEVTVLSDDQEMTLKRTAKGGDGTEHAKIQGELTLGRENQV